MEKILNYIGGQLLEPVSGQFLENYNPAKGEVYSLIADSDERDVELAVQAAEKAFPRWSTISPQDRSKALLKLAQAIEDRLEEFAYAESVDNGKPIALARSVDIPRAVANLRFFATAILHSSSEAHQMDDATLNYTLRQPIGVVGCISPWNLPLYLFTWKIAPALASGNCVVAKPSEITPMTACKLSEIAIECGFPEGVLNIVHGLGPKSGQAIVAHPKTKAISFTGGTATGEHLARTAAPMFKKLSLELGGKNAAIVFEHANYQKALNTIVQSAFSNQGQICLCTSRIFVHRSLYDRFRTDFTRKVSELLNGNPLDEHTRQGAVVSKAQFDKVLSYIELAKSEGGTILTGGHAVIPDESHKNGWFIAPTVVEGLSHTARVNQEEIFGPVATLLPFDTEEEVLAMANSTKYGLAASIWTEELSQAQRVSAKIESGIVWVNCWMVRDLRTPFGGVKASGVGREGGWEALRFFTEAKNVCVKF